MALRPLDLTFLGGRHSKPLKEQPAFGGGWRCWTVRSGGLKGSREPYTVERSGNIILLHLRGHVIRYFDNRIQGEGRRSQPIILCCKMVKNAAESFITRRKIEREQKIEAIKADKELTDEQKEIDISAVPPAIPHYGKYLTRIVNQTASTEYFQKGNRLITLVDVNHCYWRIAFNEGIINQKLYEKFKDNRDPRLIAIGNCRKDTVKKYYQKGTLFKTVKIPNPLEWVWHLILWKAYTIVSESINKVDAKIFAYMTDGVYLPPDKAPDLAQALHDAGLPSKIENYEAIGYSGHYVVLRNLETGYHKRANLGTTARSVLTSVDYTKINAEDEKKKAASKEEVEKDKAVKPATKGKARKRTARVKK